MLSFATTLFTKEDRQFATRIKRYGDRGSPYLMPLVGLEKGNGSPFNSTLKEIVAKHRVTHLNHFLEKPIFNIQVSRKSHSTLSYAFCLSSLRTAWNFFFIFRTLDWCRTFCTTMILSWIYLPLTNALCSSNINLGGQGFNLLAIVLEMILYTKLQRLLGRN